MSNEFEANLDYMRSCLQKTKTIVVGEIALQGAKKISQ